MPFHSARHATLISHSMKVGYYCGKVADNDPTMGSFKPIVLYILWALTREPQLNNTQLWQLLNRCHMAPHHMYLKEYTAFAHRKGWLTRTRMDKGGRAAYWYSISAEGRIFLLATEQAIRKMRIPKHCLMMRASELSLGYYHRNRDKINATRRKNPPTP
jgi:DNA-binding PadR family transcriptional regulator